MILKQTSLKTTLMSGASYLNTCLEQMLGVNITF